MLALCTGRRNKNKNKNKEKYKYYNDDENEDDIAPVIFQQKYIDIPSYPQFDHQLENKNKNKGITIYVGGQLTPAIPPHLRNTYSSFEEENYDKYIDNAAINDEIPPKIRPRNESVGKQQQLQLLSMETQSLSDDESIPIQGVNSTIYLNQKSYSANHQYSKYLRHQSYGSTDDHHNLSQYIDNDTVKNYLSKNRYSTTSSSSLCKEAKLLSDRSSRSSSSSSNNSRSNSNRNSNSNSSSNSNSNRCENNEDGELFIKENKSNTSGNDESNNNAINNSNTNPNIENEKGSSSNKSQNKRDSYGTQSNIYSITENVNNYILEKISDSEEEKTEYSSSISKSRLSQGSIAISLKNQMKINEKIINNEVDTESNSNNDNTNEQNCRCSSTTTTTSCSCSRSRSSSRSSENTEEVERKTIPNHETEKHENQKTININEKQYCKLQDDTTEYSLQDDTSSLFEDAPREIRATYPIPSPKRKVKIIIFGTRDSWYIQYENGEESWNDIPTFLQWRLEVQKKLYSNVLVTWLSMSSDGWCWFVRFADGSIAWRTTIVSLHMLLEKHHTKGTVSKVTFCRNNGWVVIFLDGQVAYSEIPYSLEAEFKNYPHKIQDVTISGRKEWIIKRSVIINKDCHSPNHLKSYSIQRNGYYTWSKGLSSFLQDNLIHRNKNIRRIVLCSGTNKSYFLQYNNYHSAFRHHSSLTREMNNFSDDPSIPLYINPFNVRFSSTTVSVHIKTDTNVRDLIRGVKTKALSYHQLPTLRIIQDPRDGRWWTLDNYWLWVLKEAGIRKVPIKSLPWTREFLKRVRGKWDVTILNEDYQPYEYMD